MRIDILTLFPGMFRGPFDDSIIKRAREKDRLSINIIDIRDYAQNKHKTVDDAPYGGGAGMVLEPCPIFEALEDIKASGSEPDRVILLTPQGMPFDQQWAKDLSCEQHIVLICGHYEGVDERVREILATDELSIGDYVLTGGELPAMVVVDAVARLVPGVLGREVSAENDSFYDGLLEHPHYTRPWKYRGQEVPDVLLSGHHDKIRRWRRRESLLRTLARRPELLCEARLTDEDVEILMDIKKVLEALT